MNKLILIGNGFDLAHGLPTSYNDFLNSFWSNLKKNYQNDLVKTVVAFDEEHKSMFDIPIEVKNFKDFWDIIINYRQQTKIGSLDSKDFIFYTNSPHYKIIFNIVNDFLKKITIKQNIENWVDVENEYYQELKKIVNQSKKTFPVRMETDEQFSRRKKEEVIRLNKEFEQIKELLKKYLVEHVKVKYNFLNVNTPEEYNFLLDILQSNNFFQNTFGFQTKLKKYSNEFSYAKDRYQIHNLIQPLTLDSNRTITYKTLFVDFNYTSTVSFYMKKLKDFIYEYSVLKIHGDFNEPIFGFGDETDEEYKNIENIDDNEYLKNFKSFYYSNDNSYDKLLQYIDSAKFQVWVMGHSCGLSDRVMLNTIFEHENCRSIKLFYHEKDGKDNYQDLVMNISRHFKDKTLMRRKVVDKTLCSPLPQGVRFKKKEG